MSRILSRDCGFKMIFQYLFNPNVEISKLFEEYDLTDDEKEFSLKIFSAVKDNFESLNKILETNLKKITIKDIYKVDYATLLSCLAQIEILKEPISLSINEAINTAKKYSTDNSPSFVNGVLSTIYKNK